MSELGPSNKRTQNVLSSRPGAKRRRIAVSDEDHTTLPAPMGPITDHVDSEPPVASQAPTPTRVSTPLLFAIRDELDAWNLRAPTSLPQNDPICNDEPAIAFDSRVLAHNWLLNSGLASARIWVRVANSKPSHLSAGFADGTFEGERAMVVSASSPAVVNLHMNRFKFEMEIPLRFLCPELPTGKGQPVVIIEGAHAGRVFVTRAKNKDGEFPLVLRGYSRGKAPPPLTLGASLLARCDPL